MIKLPSKKLKLLVEAESVVDAVVVNEMLLLLLKTHPTPSLSPKPDASSDTDELVWVDGLEHKMNKKD